MKRPIISWKIDYFLDETWLDKEEQLAGVVEKDVQKINNKTDEVCPVAFMLHDGIEERVVFYDNIAYVYGFKNDKLQGECSRQFDVSAGPAALKSYLAECEKKLAAA